MYIWDKIASVLAAALLLSCFGVFSSLENGHKESQFFSFHIAGGLAFLYTIIYWFARIDEFKKQVNSIDLSLLIYTAYAVFQILANPLLPWHTHHLLTVALLLGTYVFFRTFLSSRYFLKTTLTLLLVVAIGQITVGWLQWGGYLPSWNKTFQITGTFFNPAPYAGFLVLILPIALAIGLSVPLSGQTSIDIHRSLRYVGLTAVIGIMFTLLVAESRASWIASVVSSVIVISYRFNILGHISQALRSQFAIKLFTTAVMLLVGIGLGSLFYIRPASALSRLLTWKVSGRIIWDHPLWGVGYDQFSARFGQYQAAYFAQYPNSPLSSLAGQGEYAFNMFIEIAVEQGLLGLGLLFVLITLALSNSLRSQNLLILSAGASIMAILTFGMFSYPFVIVSIQINFYLLLALIATQQPATIQLPLPTLFIRCTLLPGLVVLLLYLGHHEWNRYQAHQRWKIASEYKDFFYYEEAIPIYQQIYPVLKDDGKFLLQYGQALSLEGQHKQAIAVLKKTKQRTTDTYLYTTLGESYQALAQYEQAQACFEFAINHNPYRFYPRYLLAQLFIKTGETDKALKVAKETLSMDVKVSSRQVENIRKEMQALILKLNVLPTE